MRILAESLSLLSSEISLFPETNSFHQNSSEGIKIVMLKSKVGGYVRAASTTDLAN
jgi:hypothetical protein